MTKPQGRKINFSQLMSFLNDCIDDFPDKRSGRNCQYSMQDIARSAFSIFYLQNPSFLSYQKKMQISKCNNNAKTLFGIKKIPTDNHIRDVLDYVSPHLLNNFFTASLKLLDEHKVLDDYRFFKNQLLLAIDGTQIFSSKKVKCDDCFQVKKNKDIIYSHKLITPVIVKPEKSHVISLAPEFIVPQDGADKQDHELTAAKRWLKQHGKYFADLGTTILGDDLYSNQPFCKLLLNYSLNFIFTCKPSSHKIMYEMLHGYDCLGTTKNFVNKTRVKNKLHTETYKYINGIRIKDGQDALNLNWCSVTVTDHNNKQIYKNDFVTNFKVTEQNIVDIVKAGRARWKVENENNNTLKRHGYNLEHNFGHGNNFLCNLLATLNIIAFAFHTILEMKNLKYQQARAQAGARYSLFDNFRILSIYMLFRNWEHLFDFMLSEEAYYAETSP